MNEDPDLRPSPIAGTWYPGSNHALTQLIDRYLDEAAPSPLDGKLIGVVAPHAGYRYSGQTAAYAFDLLRGQSPDLVILLSPLHAYVQGGLFTSGHQAYATPLGKVEIDAEALVQFSMACDDAGLPLKAIRFDQEHSLEIELPFMQRVLAKPFKILPLMVRERDPDRLERLGLLLAEIAKPEQALFIASTDLSHFFSLEQAQIYDQHMLQQIQNLSPRGVLRAEETGEGFACGAPGVAAFLWAAKALGANNSQVLHYSTSAGQTGDTSSVVGYGAAAVTIK